GAGAGVAAEARAPAAAEAGEGVTMAVVSIEEAMRRRAAALNARVASCHETVACPRCSAPRGLPCASLRGFGGYLDGERLSPVTKHPRGAGARGRDPAAMKAC